MTDERARRVYELFDRAITLEIALRSDFLDRACPDDPGVRREVEDLLAQNLLTDELPVSPILGSIDRSTSPIAPTNDGLPDGVGRYEVLEKLGEGGMGVVFLARDPKLDRKIALKVLPASFSGGPDRVERFRREAKMLAAVNHPGIAVIHSIEETETTLFLTMEHVPGVSLERKLAEEALPPTDSLNIGRQIAAAVEAAHGSGVIHRDLKPGNVMLTPDGLVKVLDFGLATPVASVEKLTVDGGVLGTPGYMSPEQLRGEGVDGRTDVWATGCLLYEFLSGTRAFPGRTVAESAVATFEREPDWGRLPDSTSAAMRQLLDGCLAKDPDSRIETMTTVRREIEEEIAQTALARRPRMGPARSASPNNLPQQLTSFIGRERELKKVELQLSKHRLVTLTGAGGCGKTRLALEAGSHAAERFEHGVWLVDLAPLRDAGLVTQTVAMVLRVEDKPDRRIEDVLTEHLHTRQILLILDNCEHVLDAVVALATAMLQTGPEVRILCTSREALRVTGETLHVVPTLSTPEEVDMATVEALQTSEAVQLFVDRAQAADTGFRLTEENGGFVAEICQRLDGIPLALELAAARTRVLSPRDLAQRLDERFAVLTGGSRTALPRHQTLRGLIDWSYEQLDDQEQMMLRRLSLFAGGWTLAAAEWMCAGSSIEPWDVLDLMTCLVDKSLVESVLDKSASAGQTRYRMLETVREYALERLGAANEDEGARQRHREYFLALAEEMSPRLRDPEQEMWLSRLGADHENLHLAVDDCVRAEAGEPGLRLITALRAYWLVRGHWRVGRDVCARALVGPAAGKRTVVRAQALSAAGALTTRCQDDYPAARAYFDESLSIFRELGDRRGVASALMKIGQVASFQGDHVTARAHFEECLASFREFGDRGSMAMVLGDLGILAGDQGDYPAARAYLTETVSIFRELGDQWNMALSLHRLAYLARLRRDYADARVHGEESLSIFRDLGGRGGIAHALSTLGEVAQCQDEHETARAYLEESLAMFRELASRPGIALVLRNLGNLAMHRGDVQTAQAHCEESVSINRELGDEWNAALSLSALGLVALRRGDHSTARSQLEKSLSYFREHEHPDGTARNLGALGMLAASVGQPARAARLLAASEAQWTAMGAVPDPQDRRGIESTIASLHSTLGESAYETESAAGRAMSIEEAIDHALGDQALHRPEPGE